MNIAQLTEQDVTKLQKLNLLFGTVFNDPESYQHHKPSEEYLRNFLANKNNIVLVAEHNNDIIGGLVAYYLVKFEQERKEIYLYDLAVASHMQRRGVGRKLVEQLRQIAKRMGAYVVFVQADEGEDAIKFYESLQPSENLKTRSFDFEV